LQQSAFFLKETKCFAFTLAVITFNSMKKKIAQIDNSLRKPRAGWDRQFRDMAENGDELRAEYDLKKLLKGGVRGKYAERYKAGTNLVLLAPDVAKAFPDEESVNEALRLVIQLSKIKKKTKVQTT
jgi:hypothetical protein